MLVSLAVALAATLAFMAPPGVIATTRSSPATTARFVTPSTPCDRATLRWPLSRLTAQLLMLMGTFTDPGQLAPAAVAGVGALEMAFAPGVEPRTTPSTAARVGQEDASLVSDATQAGKTAPVISTDEEGGVVTRLGGMLGALPAPRQMASTWTPAEIEQVMAARAREMKGLGIDMDTGPLYDIAPVTDTTGGEGSRTFSASPTAAATDANAFSEGLAAGGVLAVAKQFPGTGHASADTDWSVAVDPPIATLRAHDLVTFEKAISIGVPVIMVGHPIVPGLTDGQPASLSAATYSLLRGTLGFTGLVITDTLGEKAISDPGYSEPEAAAKAVEAGADMPMVHASTWQAARDALEHAVTTGALTMHALRTRVAHVLAAKGVCADAPLTATP